MQATDIYFTVTPLDLSGQPIEKNTYIEAANAWEKLRSLVERPDVSDVLFDHVRVNTFHAKDLVDLTIATNNESGTT